MRASGRSVLRYGASLMPIIDASDPACWNLKEDIYASYWMTFIQGVPVSYCRAGFFRPQSFVAQRLIDVLKLTAASRVAIIGAGYGWTAEHLTSTLPGIIVVCTDTSTYLQANKNQPETDYLLSCGLTPEQVAACDDGGPRCRVQLLDADVLTESGRPQIGVCDWLISENILPWLSDGEAQALDAAMSTLGKTAHYVTPLIPQSPTAPPEKAPVWNWKSVEDWKALMPNSTIIPSNGLSAL